MKLLLSENISALRKKRAMTQEQLAEALGVTFASVSKWERGVATPELHLIAKMADLFGVSLDALVGFSVKNGGAAAIEDQIRDLLKKKRHEDAVDASEKALLRFPNDFRIIYCAGEAYTACGTELGNEQYLYRSIDLLERAVLLLPQNTDPDISEASIKTVIAQTYILLGKAKKGIEILKRYNDCGVHNALIAIAMTGNDITYKETPGFGLDDAVPYMVDAFGSIIQNAMRTMMAYANYYDKKGKHHDTREALLWLIGFLDSIKIDRDVPCYTDKLIAPCYSECANCSLLLGEAESAEHYLRLAYHTAKRFDDKPNYKLDNFKFCLGEIQNAVSYDDLGASAMEAVVKQITEVNKNEQLLAVWQRINAET